MTNRNELATTGPGGKYAHIFDKLDFNKQDYVVPTEDEQFEREKEETTAHLAGFFEMDDGVSGAEISQFYDEQVQEAEIINAERLVEEKEDELDTFTDKERQREYDTLQFAYKREKAEEEDLIEPPWSTSTDQVVNGDRPSFADVGNRSESRLRSGQASTSTASSSFGSTTQSSSTSSSSSTQRGPRKAMDEFQRMNANVQRLGVQRTTGWTDYKETEEEYFAQFAKNTPFWKRGMRKTQNFFKSGKGRITMKMGVVIALQMAMAVFGKRYEFENSGQMAIMFSLMLASFFMTRELSSEGLDVSGMIF